MAPNPTADLKTLIDQLRDGTYPGLDIREDLEKILAEVVGPTELYHIVKNVDNRLQNIETLVETVAKEVGPIVAELAGSPIIKMLTGGKKRD